MGLFNVRVALGNGTREQRIEVEANNQTDAKKFAECRTGGKAMGAHQLPTKPKPSQK